MLTLRSSALRWTLVSSAVYLAIIWIYFVLPLGAQFGRAMLGTAVFAHDAVLNAGILEWVRRAMLSPSLHVFEWPPGFPGHDTLANTENLLGWQPAFGLLRWAGGSVTFAYNTLFIASFFFSAVGARLLAKRLGANEGGALLSGIIFAFVPFHLVHGSHLQTLSVCWVPFAIYCLDRYLVDGKLIDLAGVAVIFAGSFLSGLYIAFFLAIALSVYFLVALWTRRIGFQRKRLLLLFGAGTVVTVALSPIIWLYLGHSKTDDPGETVEMLTRGSMDLLALIKVPPWQGLWLGTGYPGVTTHEAAGFPGFIAMILAVAAFSTAGDSATRSTTRLLILMAAVFFAFALGPRLLFEQDVAAPLANWIPLPARIFEGWSKFIRWPMRAFLFSLIFIAVLSGLGFTALSRHGSVLQQRVSCALVALLLFFEYRPLYSYTADSVIVPDPLAVSDAYPLLANESDRSPIVELPIKDLEGHGAPMFALSTYGSAGHLRRVATMRLTRVIFEQGEEAAVARWREYNCSRVVVHRHWVPDNQIEKLITTLRAQDLPVLLESDEAVVFSLQK